MKDTNQANSGSKHDAPIAVAEWLQPVLWQLFATLEFPWNCRPETASVKFAKFIDTLERSLRTRICYLNAAETRSKSGAIVPLHYHAAFAAAKPILSKLVVETWEAGVGRTKSVGGDLALVEPYDPARGGIRYIVKKIGDDGCEWDHKNVHLFADGVHTELKSDHASLRSARRWLAQSIEGALMKNVTPSVNASTLIGRA
jgi:hypothetical protein